MFTIQSPLGFIARLTATSAQFTRSPDYVKTWKTEAGAAKALAKYADTGIGLNSDSATVVPVTEPTVQEAVAAVLSFTLTAKRQHDSGTFTADYATAASAIEGGKGLRTMGFINWRTIRYTFRGAAITTPQLRAMICDGEHGPTDACAKCDI